MTYLSDRALGRLRDAAEWPDLAGTRYEAIDMAGQGGMATVFRVRDTVLDRECAMKVLRLPEADPDLAERLRREARILAALEHPGIVPVHDFGELPDGRAFYVMKLVKGRRLDEVVAAGAERTDRLRIFERICESVAFAHAHGVIHRDLKPANIMVGAYGEVLVLDWGVARVLGAAEAPRTNGRGAPVDGANGVAGTNDGTVIGTPGYMAPEQASGRIGDVGPRADVFALGAILAFLLTGDAPAEQGASDDPHTESRADVPRALAAVCAKATAASPDDRYTDVDALASEVGRYLGGQAVSAYREPLVDRIVRLGRKHKTAILLVVAYLLLRVILILFEGR